MYSSTNLPNIGQILLASLNNALFALVTFIPRFIAGIVILLIGIIIASIVKQIIVGVLKALNIEKFLRRYNVPQARSELTWTNILAEISRWFIIIVFLMPTAEVWGLSQVDTILRSFLLYLPNVFIAVIIGLVGFVFGKLAYDIVLASTQEVSSNTSRMLAVSTQYAVNIFTILVVLTQLNVASDLIKILFQGFVAMIAIAGGIAFGLGGQRTASELLDNLKKNISDTTLHTKSENKTAGQRSSKK